MSTELIVIVSMLGLGCLVGLFYISHAMEKQRRKKALLIASLSDFAFRLQRLLDFIPAAYTSKEVRLLVLGQMRKRMEKLTQLAPDNDKFSKKLSSCNAQITDLQTAQPVPQAPQLKTPDEANELRAMLQELSKVIEYFAQAKVITVAEAQQHLAAIQQSFIEANLNYLLQMGQTARQDKKPKLALHHYQKALAEMVKRNQNDKYEDRIQKLKILLEELQNEAEAVPAQTPERASELNAGLSEMLEEQDSWKKKYF